MKTMLIVLLISICAIGMRSEALMQQLGMAKAAPAQPQTLEALMAASGKQPPAGMTLAEYAELAKKDPDAYRKLFASHQQPEERSEIDKLMNFFARLKYE